MDEKEKIARSIAHMHGGQLVVHIPGEGCKTVAALRGYGSFGNSPEKYAEKHWKDYRNAAEYVIELLNNERKGGEVT